MVPGMVFNRDGSILTSSLGVAAFFGKRHKHVLDAIQDTMRDAPECKPNFRLTSSQVSMPKGGTREEPCYDMDRTGLTLLAMGFTGMRRAGRRHGAWHGVQSRRRDLHEQPRCG
jgi:Rha family phage regulatory protein